MPPKQRLPPSVVHWSCSGRCGQLSGLWSAMRRTSSSTMSTRVPSSAWIGAVWWPRQCSRLWSFAVLSLPAPSRRIGICARSSITVLTGRSVRCGIIKSRPLVTCTTCIPCWRLRITWTLGVTRCWNWLKSRETGEQCWHLRLSCLCSKWVWIFSKIYQSNWREN